MAKYLDDNGLLYFWGKIKAAFVAKENGKGLSSNDFTDALKTKLDGIASGAEVNTIETVKVNNTALTPDANKAVNVDLSGYVEAEQGKGLSSNDYTTADKNKLAGIAAGAEVNVIDTVKVNGSALTVTDKAVNVDLSNYATKSDVSSVYKYKGTVSTYADLPSSGQTIGDVYNVETADSTHGINAGDNVAWTGSAWDVLAGTVDLSNYVQKEAGKGLSSNDFTTAEKNKLSGIEAGAQVNPTIDDALSSSSENPVQNKVINTALSGKANSVHTHTVSQITDLTAITNAEIDTIVAS